MSRPSVAGVYYPFTLALATVVAPGVAVDTVGSVKVIDLGATPEDLNPKFAVNFSLKLTANPGTVRAYLLTSHDGKKWYIAAASTTLTQLNQETLEVEEPCLLQRYIAVYIDTTGNPLATYIGTVTLLCTASVKLIDGSTIAGLVTPTLTLGTIPPTSTTAHKQGRATVLANQTTKVVTFDTPHADANYTVSLTPQTNYVTWISAKTAAGFTINVSAQQGGDTVVEWTARADA